MFAMKTLWIALAYVAAAAAAAPCAHADNRCAVTLTSRDHLQYSHKQLHVPPHCKQFVITLVHQGKLPRHAMGHNVVLTRSIDARAVAQAGLKAGATHEYVPPDDPRVLARSRLVGSNERTTMWVEVSQLKAGVEYLYFCTFPGHDFSMRGVLRLEG